jgi:hypothetical protein
MINAFQVYLMMQANSISIMLALACIATLIAALALMISESSRYDDREDYTAAKKATKWGIIFLVLAGLMPSTKTLALMYVLPKITSKEVTEPLGAEAKELYSIAKQALITLSKEKKEEKTKTE